MSLFCYLPKVPSAPVPNDILEGSTTALRKLRSLALHLSIAQILGDG